MPEGYLDVQPSPKASDLTAIARQMFGLMMRNVVTASVVYADPAHPGQVSKQGCVLASPSCPVDLTSGKQNYVHNWTRDAAISMIEIGVPTAPISEAEVDVRMAEYVTFAGICQQSAPPTEFSIACFRIDGDPRCDPGFQNCWSSQNDGPALQTLAILRYYSKLTGQAKDTARAVVERNLRFLLGAGDDNTEPGPAYMDTTFSPWEEERGHSFFVRAVQLQCLREFDAEPFDIGKPDGLDEAIVWLAARLDEHWNGEYFRTFAPDTTVDPPRDWTPSNPHRAPYDPNSDIVMACVYGAVDVSDPRLLGTAAKIRDLYADPASASFYPINRADAGLELGPLIGRYPGDFYDGDVDDSPDNKDHPWALCTCNFAELYYRLANKIAAGEPVPPDPQAQPFLAQVGLQPNPGANDAVAALRSAGDNMLQAVIYHSDNLELSEQFDQVTGFEKSVSNLTWSYAAFLSAMRHR
jgi:glucoamylase